MKDLYYELTDNGYHIFDRNDKLFHVHQYGPYIPFKKKTLEENAQIQTHNLMVTDYFSLVVNEHITIDEVPAAYLEDVQKMIDKINSTSVDTSVIEEKAQAYDILMGVSE